MTSGRSDPGARHHSRPGHDGAGGSRSSRRTRRWGPGPQGPDLWRSRGGVRTTDGLDQVEESVRLVVHKLIETAAVEHAGAVVAHTPDEWLADDRRFLSEGSMAELHPDRDPDTTTAIEGSGDRGRGSCLHRVGVRHRRPAAAPRPAPAHGVDRPHRRRPRHGLRPGRPDDPEVLGGQPLERRDHVVERDDLDVDVLHCGRDAQIDGPAGATDGSSRWPGPNRPAGVGRRRWP